MKRFVDWPRFLISLVACAVFALAGHWIFGVPYWLAFLIAMVAILLNGAFAVWEDDQPGGFDNPKARE
jgi:4-hydroxybenzoate polyprenyltransferase